jgi:hypothetical protein
VRGVGLVEQPLAGGVRHGSNDIGDGLAKLPRGREHLFTLGDRPVVAEDQRRDGHPLRRRQQRRIRLSLVGQGGGEVAIEPQEVASLIQRIDHESAEDLRDGMQPILEGRHHAKVAAAAS